jgi:rhodanese-related sulfurtransferase
MIAASILKARGIENVIDVAGGYGAIKATGLKRTDFACPSKAMKV